jgi:hypothetical protein
MIDKPTPDDQAGGRPEIKQSLSIRYAALLIASTLITGSMTFWITRAWEGWTVEKKTLILTSMVSQNLATTADGLSNELELRLALSPTDKRIIRSLFSYLVTIRPTRLPRTWCCTYIRQRILN